MNQGKKPRIVEALQRGKSIKEIARETGTSERYVFRVASQLKVIRANETPCAAPGPAMRGVLDTLTTLSVKVVGVSELIEVEVEE